MQSSKPSIIFVNQPEQIIDEALKSQIKKKKVEDSFDLSKILENLHAINIFESFRKYVPLSQYEQQGEEYYKLKSEQNVQKYMKLLDGTAHIIVEVRNDEGLLLNQESKDRSLKISLFNEESNHFTGYHYACLFLEEGEEAWFIFDDGYTTPFSFVNTLQSYQKDIETQSVSKVYKIKLEKLKLQVKKREFKEGQEITQEERKIIRQEEIENLKLQNQELQHKKEDITEKYFRQGKFNEAFQKYQKLEIHTENIYNKYAKFIEDTQEDIITIKALKIQIAQNKTVAAMKAKLYSKACESAQELLKLDPENQKMLYAQAKSLYKLSYFDQAYVELQQYIKKFPDDAQTKLDFEQYINTCKQKLEQSQKNQAKNYKKIFENMEQEEQKEKLRKLTQKSIDESLKQDKEIIINKILNKDGYEFNTEFDLIQNLDEDSSQNNI
ncbi:hypothetical protein TTHERM_00624670 (macronuclear) [Tetrahymena thermophila SB210]|uniref:Uncharacterized protein n=1 Tax=Tetrahymena thermophila (strain SB210) TaxID=312017 RepID=Q240R6_TETTS|nr:hypothetical protein TTHERM_00624670 [Tetrahymena thermophila SB210]EAS02348.2 hypothetical protein TTHERM_00624670 [Tetrahymena thermophila SB210]|eukprot:XP_001022593.2 hypothetical protein TTHERM_00624670 [Tetrahymena thermophila SB210]